MAGDHAGCAQELLDVWRQACANIGGGYTEITVSTAPPLVPNPYIHSLTCPHGITFWMEPTGEQIAEWRRNGVL